MERWCFALRKCCCCCPFGAARYQREPALFEWFFGYTALRRLIRTYISKKRQVLHIGCGTSNMQEGMARSGYSITNVSGLVCCVAGAGYSFSGFVVRLLVFVVGLSVVGLPVAGCMKRAA
jgi:hypothetical protein